MNPMKYWKKSLILLISKEIKDCVLELKGSAKPDIRFGPAFKFFPRLSTSFSPIPIEMLSEATSNFEVRIFPRSGRWMD